MKVCFVCKYRFIVFFIIICLCLINLLSCNRIKKDLISDQENALLTIQISNKPSDANLNWKRVIGKYQKMDGVKFDSFLIREDSEKLFMYYQGKDYELKQLNFKEYRFQNNSPFKTDSISFVIDKKGNVPLCKIKEIWFEQVYFDSLFFDFTNYIAPSIIIKKDLPELVSIKEIDPTIQINLRFMPKQTAYLTIDAARALHRANQMCKKNDYSIILYDSYRPNSFGEFIEPFYPQSAWKNYQFDFNAGKSIAIGLYNIKTAQIVDMGSHYLEFSERSSTSYIGGSSLQRWNRLFLQSVMKKAGFSGTDLNWWYFTYKVVN